MTDDDPFAPPPGQDPPGEGPAGPGPAPAGPPKLAFDCEHCGKTLRADRRRAGQSTACPQCGLPVVVPGTPHGPPHDPSADVSAGADGGGPRCPMCGAANAAGSSVCRGCGERLPGGGGPVERRTGTVSLRETFSVGWRLTQRHFGLLLGAVMTLFAVGALLGCLLTAPFSMVSTAVLFANGPPGMPGAANSGSCGIAGTSRTRSGPAGNAGGGSGVRGGPTGCGGQTPPGHGDRDDRGVLRRGDWMAAR